MQGDAKRLMPNATSHVERRSLVMSKTRTTALFSLLAAVLVVGMHRVLGSTWSRLQLPRIVFGATWQLGHGIPFQVVEVR